MNGEALYLRQDIQIEPLVDQWYAWSQLIPPATTARNITNRHLPIMESYIAAPEVHAKAAANPKLLGGPFIDHGGRRVTDVRTLKERTEARRAGLIELSEALEELDKLLRNHADGHSLQGLYARVPVCLRGFVELTYDLHNNPSFRLIEPLLYLSKYYDKSAQSLMLSKTTGDDRPFAMSTPRLTNEHSLHLPWTFDDERVDRLFQLKVAPQPWECIVRTFGVDVCDEPMWRSLLTTAKPSSYTSYRGSGLRWRYFGHACVLLETRDISILFDPVISYSYETDIPRYTYADLPDSIDCVLITHNHQDHILLETLLQLRHKVRKIVVPKGGHGGLQDPSLRLALQQIGFQQVMELGECETLELPGMNVLGIPFLGEHCDLAISTKLAYIVTVGSERLMFAADSCNIEPLLYEHIHAAVGDVGTLFLGMECVGAPMTWAYGPLLLHAMPRSMDHSRRLNGCDYAQAVELVQRFGFHDVYVYAMGQEPWLNHVMSIKYTEQSRPIVESNRLIDHCRSSHIVAERLYGEKEILIDRDLRRPIA
jgi:L-ascorbate metabolism protein UlaG (beta-lactamase superfamily)